MPDGESSRRTSGRKRIYCPFAASMKIKSYGPSSSFKICAASPDRSRILSPAPIFAKFSLAFCILSGSFSIVVIRAFSGAKVYISDAEKPVAVPASRIAAGFRASIRNLIRLCVCVRMIGIPSASASLSISFRRSVLPGSSDSMNVRIFSCVSIRFLTICRLRRPCPRSPCSLPSP